MTQVQALISGLLFTLAALTFAAPAAANLGDYSASLRPSVTVAGSVVTLGDLFDGDIMRPDKAIAKAPEPGQRFVLGANWFSSVAQTYGHRLASFEHL